MATVAEREHGRLRLVGGRRFGLDVEPAVYGTVVLMTVLVVALDDGIDDVAEACQVIIGPLVATFVAHLFAAVLAAVNAERRLPTRSRLGELTVHAAQYLVLAVGPVLVVAVVTISGGSAETAVVRVVQLGLVVLMVLGAVGGWRALGRWWAALLGAVGAGILGFVVLLLRIVLEH